MPAGQPPAAQANKFITSLFNDLFHRPATPTEVTMWAGRITSGTPRATVVQSICSSPDADLHTGEIADLLFREFLERPADPSSRAQLSNQLKNGVQPTVVAILSSDEYDKAATA
jgi:hypothetical protein